MPPPPSIYSYKPKTAQIQDLDESLQPARKIWPSLVTVTFCLPYNVNGLRNTYCKPISISDIFITFTNNIIIPEKLIYLHPLYNYAILTYDKTLLGETPIKAIELSDKKLVQGDSIYLIGICNDCTPVVKKTTVKRIINVYLSKCFSQRWKALNFEDIRLDDFIDSLAVGDIILTINNNMVTKMSDLPITFHYLEEVDILILHDGKELNIKVKTTPYYGKETTKIIGWSGAIIQEPYKAALERIKNVPTGVYITFIYNGLPALKLKQGVWIVELQGRKVNDIDSFLKAIYAHEKEIKEKPEENNDGYVRIKTISGTNVTEVVTMKLDPCYWDIWQLVEDKEALTGWKFIET
ncbi:hypothetical protein RclHR1_07110007 [Rhizophagus clarus]|uniref:PDZ-like domain-containing protein n=1 Tax=Rhizophagus clarus TaxID=94130 RepID=A0A2Z6SC11_9GLOM|nr:hypothetical protein RclHR1_07110007 [Rhizophagus clarus]